MSRTVGQFVISTKDGDYVIVKDMLTFKRYKGKIEADTSTPDIVKKFGVRRTFMLALKDEEYEISFVPITDSSGLLSVNKDALLVQFSITCHGYNNTEADLLQRQIKSLEERHIEKMNIMQAENTTLNLKLNRIKDEEIFYRVVQFLLVMLWIFVELLGN